ncbi:alpha/beta fold hydrolase [Amycolatopsis jejuensis]|uniref:alpha/beta fold hydrolase n=1 Tax=Amycolatopsis jejuensis TaxID=330084 RepID=UPI000525A7A8|nr:alpha/beta fold hydrolase [Amycolatopsis jejuensis]
MVRVRALAAVVATGAGLLAGAGFATAGPVSEGGSGLDRYYHQRLDWKACGVKNLDDAGAQCADVTVPLDYSRPGGRTIKVAISRLKATDPGQRRGVMLSNPGGPGAAGLDMMLDVRTAMTPAVTARYDLIGMDPRGIGRSTPVNCGWPVGTMFRSAGIDRTGFDRTLRLEEKLAGQCFAAEGPGVRQFTTRNTARDMDVVRGALGEPKVSYFGWSYGTYLGAVYTQMFPQRSDRIVLDSAIDPKHYGVGSFQAMGPANEAGLDDWAAWTAARDGEYHLGTTGAQVRAQVENLIRGAAKSPIKIGTHQVDEHLVPTVLFNLLADQRLNDVPAALVRQLVDAAAGKPVQIDPRLDFLLTALTKPTPETQGSGEAPIACGDVWSPHDPEYYWRTIERNRASQPVFGGFANGPTACAFWLPPVEPPTAVHNSVPTLIVQATRDSRTPYAEGVGLHQALTASRMVTLQDVRVHAVFGHYPNACVEKAVNTYFSDGVLPSADTTC